MRGRREERRARTIDEIVETALAVMGESGAAGLSLGEVAKRMGLRTPSLYVYFANKAALCDEIFRRGWSALREELAPHLGVDASTDLADHVERVTRVFVGWALAHPAEAQLMTWRPIAGWEPSPEAYEPAVEVRADLARELESACAAGLLRPEPDIGEMSDVLSILSMGIVSQQLSNEPGAGLDTGSYAARIPRLAQMFVTTYGRDTTRGRRR